MESDSDTYGDVIKKIVWAASKITGRSILA